MTKQQGVTGLLIDWRHGDVQALERLVPLVYDELRKVARGQLRHENVGHSLQATIGFGHTAGHTPDAAAAGSAALV